MRELLPYLSGPVALATVIGTRGNTPRGAGTALARSGSGVLGAVSGGCVEAEVHRLCGLALAGGPPSIVDFGYTPDDVFAVGLSCEGAMRVLVQRVSPADPAFAAVATAVAAGDAVGWARIVSGPWTGHGIAVRGSFVPVGALPDPVLERRIAAETAGMLAAGTSGLRVFERAGAPPTEVFVESFPALPRLLVYGAVDFASALAELALPLGYRVTVCDPRPVFADPVRFPAGVEVVVDWPHRHFAATRPGPDTAVCVLTHEPRFDVPLLALALRAPLAFVGALGSRRSAARRTGLLLDEGLTPEEIARLRAPIGLDLGGRSPHETALSILAEVTAVRRGGTGGFLTGGTGPIHDSERRKHDARPAPALPAGDPARR
ncbi:hypothetical protein Afil01_23640 [Actinorhabdospora filicis]|uniref:Xanthine dehydrogenase accessory factor n=1 Tax=Actinorhabdospora filicis TaxID=1785913 RepID=A0A9W6W2Z3_9ACTN|nr:XdhC/CoxI family protein [Actinorhabdospora filicis]GLZ77557.1 hypothetical protein Afil01_23640 [Actinorhabdospora filicis]